MLSSPHEGSPIMKRYLASALIVGVSTFGLVGCDEKSAVKTETVTETPGGGKIKETDEHKVVKSGDAKDSAAPTTPEAPK